MNVIENSIVLASAPGRGMKLERVLECPLCGVYEAEIRDSRYKLVFCECGLVYQQFYMSEVENRKYYEWQYRKAFPPYNNNIEERDIKLEELRGTRNASYLSRSGISPKRHLDVGCSSGVFMEKIHGLYGCESVGVEPGHLFRDYSISQGVNVVEDISQVTGKFDFITLSHVLEHLVNPLEMLSNIWDLLEDDGLFYVEVPHRMMSFSHPTMWDELSLWKILLKTNYEIIECKKRQGTEIKLNIVWAMARKKREGRDNNNLKGNDADN